MDSQKRTRLWSRDTRWLRILSGLIGTIAVLWAAVLIGLAIVAAKTFGPNIGQLWISIAAAVQLAIGGLFLMACGRVLASIAEIAWFSSPENPENTALRRQSEQP